MHGLRNAHPAPRISGDAPLGKPGNVSLRNLHSHSLLLRAGIFRSSGFFQHALFHSSRALPEMKRTGGEILSTLYSAKTVKK
jgi:hypothetical protein